VDLRPAVTLAHRCGPTVTVWVVRCERGEVKLTRLLSAVGFLAVVAPIAVAALALPASVLRVPYPLNMFAFDPLQPLYGFWVSAAMLLVLAVVNAIQLGRGEPTLGAARTP
jgi:hypothetical protein